MVAYLKTTETRSRRGQTPNYSDCLVRTPPSRTCPVDCLVPRPDRKLSCPRPLTLRCQVQYVKLLPLLTKETPAPGAVLQLIRCNCGSTIVESTSKTCRCSCKQHNLVCTELCNCVGYDKCLVEHSSNPKWTWCRE